MKKIEAIINPSELDDITNALENVGIDEITTSEVRAFGRRKAHLEVYRGTQFEVGFRPELKIEVVIPDEQMEAVVAAIVKGARTTGDRRVLIADVEEANDRRVEAPKRKAA